MRLSVPLLDLGRALLEIAKEAGARIRSFSRLSTPEVQDLTGLPDEQVARARLREHTEPFVLEAGSEEFVRRAAERRGLRVIRGGRFHHLSGELDKGRAVRQVLTLLAPAASIGLGLRLWIAGLIVWLAGHTLAVWVTRKDPAFLIVLSRHARHKGALTC